MPDSSRIPHIDRQRPECVALDNRIKQRRASLARFRQQLQQTQDLEEREEILRNIDALSEEIDALREELGFTGCYIVDVPQRNLFLKVIGIEATQSTQYFSIEGTGAGPDNSIRFIENKQMLVRVYIRNTLLEAMTITGRLSMHAFNANTLKYDVLRKQYAPMNPVSTAAQSASTRAQFNETLNFLVPASDCHGNVRLSILVWRDGHEGDPIYEGEGAIAPVAFAPTRQPIIHCFRVQFTLTSTTPPTVFAAPTFESCAATIRFAERLFPIAGMSIIDRGTIEMSGASLTTQNDFDAVRQWIQRLRDATIQEDPAGGLILPEENIIYAGFLSNPGGATIWGNAVAGSIESIAGFGELFAHELGHLLLPGEDHIVDTVCNLNPTGPLDPNYPDYANTARTAGIGEFGVDLGQTPTLYNPDTPDIMSYCANRWISPYNYTRATFGEVLSPHGPARAARAGAQKLLVGFRLYRDGRAELQSALHVPGEVLPYPPKSPTGITLELLDTGGSLLATIDCGRSADRHGTAPYEDFQVAMLWHEQAQHLVAVQDGREIARWEIEQPVRERIAANLTCRRQARDNGEHVWRVGWSAARRENVTFTLRFTPDDGKTWLAVAAGTRGTEVDVDESGLPAGPKCRFQLLTSTGFRTIAEESEEVFLSPRQRQIAIVEPGNEAGVSPDGGLWLSGIAASLLGEEGKPVDAFWSSNRDGFIGNGLSVHAPRLSPGRHVLTLTVDDGSGGELTARVTVHVRQGGSAPAQTTYAGARH